MTHFGMSPMTHQLDSYSSDMTHFVLKKQHTLFGLNPTGDSSILDDDNNNNKRKEQKKQKTKEKHGRNVILLTSST